MMRSAIQEELDKNGITVCTTRGDSMEPLLANRRDIVTIQKIEPGQRLKKYDVPLYRRDGGENYVLHRILKVREQDYGSPERSFGVIGQFWETYLQEKCLVRKSGPVEAQVLPEDVAAMMCLFKIARIATGHGKADNWIDLAGYAACGGELEAEG